MSKQNKVINAASYERVSSEEQAREGFSLQVQSEKNVAYIKSQEGWEFIESYIDPGKSGKNLKRPDMQRLIHDINSGLINAVVVHKLDRLTRNVGDLHYLLSLFDAKGVKLVSISENIDTSTAMGRMFVFMLGILAQWYRENLSEEVIKGQTKRTENGFRNTSSAPYGYNVGDNLVLTVNNDADTVKQIFDWYTNGKGLNMIATMLNNRGISSPGGSTWQPRNIAYIIDNVSYIGAVHWKQRDDSEDKRIIVNNIHEPIITQDVFDSAQEIRGLKKEHAMNHSSYGFPFSTVAKCAECGRSFHGKIKHRQDPAAAAQRHYVCSGRYRQDDCKGPSISEPKLTKLFLEFISNFTFEVSEPNKTITKGRDITKDKKKLEKLISDISLKRKNYLRAMGDNKITYEEFLEIMDEENKKADAWQKELDEINEITMDKTRTRRDVLALLNNLAQEWEGMNIEERKFNVQMLFRFLVIKKENKEWKVVAYKLNE
jgi:site-specific DNA recombinase